VAAAVAEDSFRPFGTTKPHGTGLGLASSRSIIESPDGTMGYDSLPGGQPVSVPFAGRAADPPLTARAGRRIDQEPV